MAALTAAQIEDSIVALDAGTADQQVDFLRGVAIVLDHIAVGFEIERAEQGPPPIRWEMAFEIGHRAQSPRAYPSSLVGALRFHTGWPDASGPHTAGLPVHTRTPELSSIKKAASRSREPLRSRVNRSSGDFQSEPTDSARRKRRR